MSFFDPFGIADSFLNPGKPYKKAAEQYQQGWNQAQAYEKPYWQNGMDQISKLIGAENKLMDPAALQNEWASGYEMSPYAKQLQNEANTKGLDAASSQGLLGSSSSIQNIQQGASNIMQKDREQYMNDLMEKYMKGIGIGTDIYGKGAMMGGQLGKQAMDYGNKMGEAKFGESDAMRNQMLQMAQLYLASQGGGF